jgi:hypothetical protein
MMLSVNHSAFRAHFHQVTIFVLSSVSFIFLFKSADIYHNAKRLASCYGATMCQHARVLEFFNSVSCKNIM